MKFVRIYSFHGEPLADVFLEGNGGLRLQQAFEPHRIDPKDWHRYSRYQVIEQKMIKAKPMWLEPT